MSANVAIQAENLLGILGIPRVLALLEVEDRGFLAVAARPPLALPLVRDRFQPSEIRTC